MGHFVVDGSFSCKKIELMKIELYKQTNKQKMI